MKPKDKLVIVDPSAELEEKVIQSALPTLKGMFSLDRVLWLFRATTSTRVRRINLLFFLCYTVAVAFSFYLVVNVADTTLSVRSAVLLGVALTLAVSRAVSAAFRFANEYKFDVLLVTDDCYHYLDGVFYVDDELLKHLEQRDDFQRSFWTDHDTLINTGDLRTLEASNATKA